MTIIDEVDRLDELMQKLKESKEIAIDLEVGCEILINELFFVFRDFSVSVSYFKNSTTYNLSITLLQYYITTYNIINIKQSYNIELRILL